MARVRRACHMRPALACSAERSLEYAEAHIFERVSVARDHEVLTEALRHGRGQVNRQSWRVCSPCKSRPAQFCGTVGEIATAESLQREREMVAWVNQGIGKCEPLGGNQQFVASDRLRPEQKRAVDVHPRLAGPGREHARCSRHRQDGHTEGTAARIGGGGPRGACSRADYERGRGTSKDRLCRGHHGGAAAAGPADASSALGQGLDTRRSRDGLRTADVGVAAIGRCNSRRAWCSAATRNRSRAWRRGMPCKCWSRNRG